jgi:hypothetical protein
LKAVKIAAHSGYSNLINLSALEDVVVVHGKESYGNYVEIVDLKTGKTLAHRVYDEHSKVEHQ